MTLSDSIHLCHAAGVPNLNVVETVDDEKVNINSVSCHSNNRLS